MGELLERSKLSKLVWSQYKENSDYFAQKYEKSDDEVTSIPISKIEMGGFYFLHYRDSSNWMQYSPVFTVSFKKVNNILILYAINLNFIPIDIRVEFFDKFMDERNFDKDLPLKVDFKGVYDELMRYGFEYGLMEFVLNNVLFVHKINMNSVPRFLYSGHPLNKYDPKKLGEIQMAKKKDRSKRHQEMTKLMMTDLIEINEEISETFDVLKNHVQRIRNNIKKL
jgi:hypothetical protein